MCGVIGIVADGQAAELACEGLRYLQHRGQDATGIASLSDNRFHQLRELLMVSEFQSRLSEKTLPGKTAIGHVRYATSGSARAQEEIQPLQVGSTPSICLAHNGNLLNCELLAAKLAAAGNSISSNSDSELAASLLASELAGSAKLDPLDAFKAVSAFHRSCTGAYAIVALIENGCLLAFRDPSGIRPLCFGTRIVGGKTEYVVASESAAVTGLGFAFERSIEPGEAILIDPAGKMHSQQCASSPKLQPCIFEYVYFARPDSVLDSVLVYEARIAMGRRLALRAREHEHLRNADAVIPVPDSSRHAALEFANVLGVPYREGLIRNKFSGRSFIMPSQPERQQAVRRKLSIIESEFSGRNVIIVDDSIVRGTTCREIVGLARSAGAKQIHVASTAPPVMYPSVYGIDMPTRAELVANNCERSQIAQVLNADSVLFQTLEDLEDAVRETAQLTISSFDSSCFNGKYPVGKVDLDQIERAGLRRQAGLPKPDCGYQQAA